MASPSRSRPRRRASRRGPHLTLARRHPRGCGVERGELREAHVIERATHGEVEALPHAAHAAAVLDLTVAVAGGAVGEGERPLERIEDRRGAGLRPPARPCGRAMWAG